MKKLSLYVSVFLFLCLPSPAATNFTWFSNIGATGTVSAAMFSGSAFTNSLYGFGVPRGFRFYPDYSYGFYGQSSFGINDDTAASIGSDLGIIWLRNDTNNVFNLCDGTLNNTLLLQVTATNVTTPNTFAATNGFVSYKQGSTAPLNIWTNIAGSNAATYWTNYTGFNGTVILGGGSLSNLWLNGTSIGKGTNTTIPIPVPFGGNIGVGYTAAPTMSFVYQ